ncbi:hypothetical protein lerEdw1_008495 [Lerista edwardsae]|nr:hypothetical protein lerEdw1_008495 [Lerista edwardsae]
MFGWSAQSWFYNCSKPAKKEDRAGSSWLADILSNHEERIVAELDVQKVLSYLVYERVFSLEEYKDILSRKCCKTRAASFLEQLSSKGPGAFSAFCSVLEKICPHLLNPILLDYQGVLNRNFPDLPFENPKLRAVSEMDVHDTSETSDLEGNPLAEDQTNHSFNKYRSKTLQYFPLSAFARSQRCFTVVLQQQINLYGFLPKQTRPTGPQILQAIPLYPPDTYASPFLKCRFELHDCSDLLLIVCFELLVLPIMIRHSCAADEFGVLSCAYYITRQATYRNKLIKKCLDLFLKTASWKKWMNREPALQLMLSGNA